MALPERSDALAPWRRRLREIIFEADTPAGKAFDVGLLVAIVASVLAVMAESVSGIRSRHGWELDVIEWVFTGLFTLEYVLRLLCVREPLRYVRSFFGVVDLLAILPTYLSLLLPGVESLLVIRGIRLLRVFRVFKLVHFLGEATVLRSAIAASRHKIIVFLGAVLVVVTILGALMYLVEGEEHGFSSIPLAVYWAIVTLTTVGYGDLAPQTVLGRILASLVMILGYSVIAVPTGLVTAEIVESVSAARRPTTRMCPSCLAEGLSLAARFCERCGAELAPPETRPAAG